MKKKFRSYYRKLLFTNYEYYNDFHDVHSNEENLKLIFSIRNYNEITCHFNIKKFSSPYTLCCCIFFCSCCCDEMRRFWMIFDDH